MVSFVVVAAVAVGLAAIAYRMYAPGDLAARIDRAQARWSIFGAGSTWTFLGRGLVITLELALISIGLSLVFAVVLALVRLSVHPQMRWPVPGSAIASRIAVRAGGSRPELAAVHADHLHVHRPAEDRRSISHRSGRV